MDYGHTVVRCKRTIDRQIAQPSDRLSGPIMWSYVAGRLSHVDYRMWDTNSMKTPVDGEIDELG